MHCAGPRSRPGRARHARFGRRFRGVPCTSTCNPTGKVALLASAASWSPRVVMAWARSLLSTVEARKRLHGLPPLGDSLRRLINRAPKDPPWPRPGAFRIALKTVSKRSSNPLKALQQGIVQFTRNFASARRPALPASGRTRCASSRTRTRYAANRSAQPSGCRARRTTEFGRKAGAILKAIELPTSFHFPSLLEAITWKV